MLNYKNYKYIICCFCLLATDREACAEEPKKWLPQIDLNIKYGNKRSIGRIGALGPIAQTNDMLTYVDFRFMADTRQDQEGNFGLGQRWLNPKMEYITGVYGYFDRRFSNLGNKYNQLTFGTEYLSTTWDYRANIYVPENKIFTKRTPRSETKTSYLGGNQRIETTDYVHVQKEVPLRGIDVEIGRCMPGLPDLRLYTGTYYYQGRAGVVSIKGYQFRSNYNLNDYVSLQTEVKRDNVRKKNYYLGIELRIPIGKESDKNRSLTTIEKRMTEAPIRDVDIVANVNESDVVENKGVAVTTTETDGSGVVVLDGANQNASSFVPTKEEKDKNKDANSSNPAKLKKEAPQTVINFAGKTKKRQTVCCGGDGNHDHSPQPINTQSNFKHDKPANNQPPRTTTPQVAQSTPPNKENNAHHHQHGANCNHGLKPGDTQSPGATPLQGAPRTTPNKENAHQHGANCNHGLKPVDTQLPRVTPSQVAQPITPNKASDTHHDHTNCEHNHSSQPVNDQLSSPITPQLSPTPTSNIASDHQHDANCDHHHSSQPENTIKENIFDSKNETYIFTDQEISTYRINLAEFLYSADSEINENLVSTPFFKAGLSKAFYAQTVGIFARA